MTHYAQGGAMLILYVSCEGQTQKIVRYITQMMQQSGVACHMMDLAALSRHFSLANQPVVLLAASVHYGKHHPLFRQFVRQHWRVLNQGWSGFLSVSLLARKAGKNSATSNPYVRHYLEKTPWKPQHIAVCAGAVSYKQYACIKRIVMRGIMALSGGDAYNDREYTNWTDIDALCQTLIEQARVVTDNEG